MKSRRSWAIICSLVLILGILAGCTGQQQSGGVNAPSPEKSSGVKYPLEVKDQTGANVNIKQEPKRIVSLAPSTTEIAFALGLGKEVVGVTTNDDYPAEVKKLPKVGDMNINPEKVLELKPDLVLAAKINSKETIDKLRKLGLPVLVVDGNNYKEVYQSIGIVGKATNRAHEADELIKKMEQEKSSLYQTVAKIPENQRVKVWVEISPQLHTAGKGTFIDELVTLASGKNVAAGQSGWPQISAEQVIKWNPDVIISTYGDTKSILERKGWENVAAVKNKRVVAVDQNLVSRPGPRIFQGYKEIIKALYPDKVK
ncbi:ABC transporter substrate-binding protein [Thermoflavimicrobium dichotomicum]|uniref:Iron complex transport system substrate-binding protein n=1 Tax=Thermoflavimicrobium dichotomicum TaxID=46223 RepID=A0A1I3RIK8_9BACL|nr:ABC transporter substrate-binding protein [Thermoflavimicrobium dichotomicum]SFJ46403.1 iron complex transport system substrate-binding protein [Thermoflavimicrobium dichotomicum]